MTVTTRIVLCVAIGFTFLARPAAAQGIDPAVEQDILKLIDASGMATGMEQLTKTMMSQVTSAMAQGRPNTPQRAFEIAQAVMTERFLGGLREPDGLLAQIVPLYAKYFTHDDIKAMLAFFDSEVGKKTVDLQPVLAAEGAKAGQAWAARVMPEIQAEILERLKAEGLAR